MSGKYNDENSDKVLAPIGLVALVVAFWWVAVATSRSLIFPTPGQVVLGIVELMQQGLLLKHVLASLLCGKNPLEDTAKLWVEDARLWN